jgi:penicillin V acylase-like amidase (Ntn superfamily)
VSSRAWRGGEIRVVTLRRCFSAALVVFLAFANSANACTRVTYIGQGSLVVTGRSMDWMAPVDTKLWAFPAGVTRKGANGEDALIWASKYGGVIAGGYDSATTDGINTKGLVANLLYLATADYGARDEKRPALSVAAWAQYALDNFATVDEATKALAAQPTRRLDLGNNRVLAGEASGAFAVIEPFRFLAPAR